MSIGRQLVKEFAIPLLVAISWTGYSLYQAPSKSWTILDCVNVFGPAFFFVSWLVAQWFRVKKQKDVEKGLVEIDARIKANLQRLDEATTRLAGDITGGDSFCYFYGPSEADEIWNNMLVMHIGKHPLYDVQARVVDVDKLREAPAEEHGRSSPSYERRVLLGNLAPEHASFTSTYLDLGSSGSRRYNVFFTARNGSFTQFLRLKRVAGRWALAIRVTRDNSVLYEKLDPDFLQGATEVDWNN